MHPSLQRLLGRLYLEKDRVHTNGDNEYAFIHVAYSASHERGAEAAWLDVLLESSIWRKEPCGPSTCCMTARDRCTCIGTGLGCARENVVRHNPVPVSSQRLQHLALCSQDRFCDSLKPSDCLLSIVPPFFCNYSDPMRKVLHIDVVGAYLFYSIRSSVI
jgi:hypothetical protein